MRYARWFSRIVSLSVAVSMLATGVPIALATTPGIVSASTVEPTTLSQNYVRLTGSGPSGSSVAVSKRGWSKSPYVVIASSSSALDQLVAAPLAGVYSAPLLLTDGKTLSRSVSGEIRRLGARTALVVGDTKRVPKSVTTALKKAGIRTTKRLGAASSSATARLVAEQIRARRGAVPAVFVVNAKSVAWGAAAVPMATKFGMPILYSGTATLATDTRRFLEARKPNQAILIGGPSSITTPQAEAIKSAAGIDDSRVMRVSGTSVYDSAAQLGEMGFAQGLSYANTAIAAASNNSDLYVAATLAARKRGMLIPSAGSAVPQSTYDFIESHCSSMKSVWLVGSSNSIPNAQLSDLKEAGQTLFKDDVKVVKEALNSDLASISPDARTLYFNSGTDLSGIEVADVLVSGPTDAAPYGYLKRVVNIESAGALVSVVTTAANLGDVIKKGSLDVKMGEAGELGRLPGAFAVKEARVVDDTHVDVEFSGLEAISGESSDSVAAGVPAGQIGDPMKTKIGWSRGVPLNQELYKSTAARVWTEGNLTVGIQIAVNASWGVTSWRTERVGYPQLVRWHWWGPEFRQAFYETRIPTGFGLESASFVTHFNEALNLKILWTGAWTMERTKDLGRIKLASAAFPIGFVPVVITFGMTPTVGVQGALGVSGSVQVTQSFNASAGYAWHYERGGTSLSSSTNSCNFQLPTGSLTGYAKGWAGVRMDAMFYDVAGPYAEPRAFLRLDGNSAWSPAFKLRAGIEMTWGGQLEFFGMRKSWGFGPATLWSTLLYPRVKIFRSMPAGAAAASPALLRAQNAPESQAETVTIDPATVQPTDFSLEPTGTQVLDAQLLPDARTVRLTTTPLVQGVTYAVNVADLLILDVEGQPVVASGAPFSLRERVAPTTSLSVPPPDGLEGWYRTPPLVTLAADEPGFTKLAWGTTTPTVDGPGFSAGTTTTAPSGENRLYYYSTDLAGNSEPVKSAPFKVDPLAPVNPPFTAGTAVSSPTNAASVSMGFAGAIDGASGVAGYSTSWTSGSAGSPDATIDTTLTSTTQALSDGFWYFNLRTVDRAGNWSAASSMGPFVIDRTPPTVLSSVPLNDATASSLRQPVSITFSEAVEFEDGGVYVQYPDGPNWLNYAGAEAYNPATRTWTWIPDADYPSCEVRVLIDGVRDPAGNWMPPTTWRFWANCE
ncbi:MAG: cell wall-binding repeat-containing protein [Coriobacteriia bacterium]|nr:cell wall-binding repeat-containing protein [Coriobacteriia bacterium]